MLLLSVKFPVNKVEFIYCRTRYFHVHLIFANFAISKKIAKIRCTGINYLQRLIKELTPKRENKVREKFKIGNSRKYDAHENIVSYSMWHPPPRPPNPLSCYMHHLLYFYTLQLNSPLFVTSIYGLEYWKCVYSISKNLCSLPTNNNQNREHSWGIWERTMIARFIFGMDNSTPSIL